VPYTKDPSAYSPKGLLVILGSPSKLKDRTFPAVFEFPAVKKKPTSAGHKPSRLYRNPVYLAQEWQKALENGDYSSPADLARKLGVSYARVNQVVRLFNLAPEVLKAIAALGDPLPRPIVTERRLRSIVNLPPEEQRQRVAAILTGKENLRTTRFENNK
jgi:hypothetical protein